MKRSRGKVWGAIAGVGASLAIAVPGIVVGASPAMAASANKGVLNYASSWAVTSFNPYLANAADDTLWLDPVYARLITLTPTGALTPGLLTSWKFTTNNTVLQLNLRQGVTFQDGTPFNADALLANLKYAQTATGSAVASLLTAITAATEVNEYQVDLTVTSAGSSIPYAFADKAGMEVSPTVLDGSNVASLSTQPVGAGAFKVTNYVVGSKATYAPFAGYWNKSDVHLSGLTISAITSDPTILTSLESGQLNAGVLPPSDLAAAKQSDLDVVNGPTLAFIDFTLNRAQAPFNNQLVREALNYGVDRNALVKGLEYGYATAQDQDYPAGYLANDPTLKDHYTYNPTKAKQLLKEAGFPNGVSFTAFVTDSTSFEQLGAAVQAQLAKAGFTMTLYPADSATISSEWLQQQKYPAYLGAWAGRPDPGQTPTLRYTPTGVQNAGGATTPQIEAALAKAQTATSAATRQTDYQAVSKTIVSEALDAPLFNLQSFGGPQVAAANVHGLKNWIYIQDLSQGITVG